LLVLGVIIVGVAITLAITSFNQNSAAVNLERVTLFLTDLGCRAQKYYRTPNNMGGGGHTFLGLTADANGIAILTNAAQNGYGAFSALTAGDENRVVLKGIGMEDGDKDGLNCTMELQVFADSMKATILSR
jgi:hypothetical protein